MFNITLIVLFLSYLFCVCCEIGDPCVDDDGITGVCTNFNRCLSVLTLMKDNKTPKICSSDDLTPIICCTDCHPGNDTSNVVLNEDGNYYFKTGQKASDKCLDYMIKLPFPCSLYYGLTRIWFNDKKCHDYVIILNYEYAIDGGEDAKRNEYPHMALLGYGDDPERVEWLCGGSVISEKYILTAAHCISSSALGPITYVAVGILKRTDAPELWHRYKVKRIIPHPDYKSPSKYHDIALLETEDTIRFSEEVLPACLNVGDHLDKWAWATGWGALGRRAQLADTLQTVVLQKYDEAVCSEHYPPHRHLVNGYDHQKQMCYGDENVPKDTCEGDSGGPLQVTSIIASCIYTIIGVTSYGRACGLAGGSGMYTRVSHYVPWIESIVWP